MRKLKISILIYLIMLISPTPFLGQASWSIDVDKGCGSTYNIGDEIKIIYNVGNFSLVEIVEKFLNESIILFKGYRTPGTYTIKGTLGNIPGIRVFEMYELKYGIPILKASCWINVIRSGEVPLMVIVIINLTRNGAIVKALYSPLMVRWEEFLKYYFMKGKDSYFKGLRDLVSSMFGLNSRYILLENRTYTFYDSEVAGEALKSIGVTIRFNYTSSEYFSVERGNYVLTFKDPLKKAKKGWMDWVIINIPKFVKVFKVSPLTTLDRFNESRVAWYNPSVEEAPYQYTIKFSIDT